MNVLIISGGSGSDALHSGIYEFFMNSVNITNLINLYDDGKSTGECRRLFDILGPSDLRKVQFSFYRNENYYNNKNTDFRINHMYTHRYSKLTGSILDEFFSKYEYDLSQNFIDLFRNVTSYVIENNIEVEDCNIANIVYSYCFKFYGIENTILLMKSFLKIKGDVVANSYDNLYLSAYTDNGYYLKSETDIVNYGGLDKINRLVLSSSNGTLCTNAYFLSDAAKRAIHNSDIIIMSPGTQFSSLIPTYMTIHFKESFSSSSAKKYLIMNNEADKDMINWTSNDILIKLSEYFYTPEITVLFNHDADEQLREYDYTNMMYKVFYFSMFNLYGKHNSLSLVAQIFSSYYNIMRTGYMIYQMRLLVDFDDTIYSRDDSHSEISRDNIKLLFELSNKIYVDIITGNSRKHVLDRLNCVSFDRNRRFNIFADGGLIDSDRKIHNTNYMLDERLADSIIEFLSNVNDLFTYEKRFVFINKNGFISENKVGCLSIRVKDINVRRVLFMLISEYIKSSSGISVRCRGNLSIDIFNCKHDKSRIFDFHYTSTDADKMIFIGDELDDGNDALLAQILRFPICVKDVYETNAILRIIRYMLAE